MKTEQPPKNRQGLQAPTKKPISKFYRVAWRNGEATGEETEGYTSFITAVQIAESLQTAANDRPSIFQFSVLLKIGNCTETVYRCQ